MGGGEREREREMSGRVVFVRGRKGRREVWGRECHLSYAVT